MDSALVQQVTSDRQTEQALLPKETDMKQSMITSELFVHHMR